MKSVIITGSCGFIGSNCVIEAISRGYTVYGFDNLRRNRTEENLTLLQNTYKDKFIFIHGDIRNKMDFVRLPKDSVGIISLAAQVGIPYAQISPFYDFEVNVVGALNVLEYSRQHGKIPVAFASSNKAYTDIVNDFSVRETKSRYTWRSFGDRQFISEFGVNERLPLDAFGMYARSLYGTSKVAADLYHQEYYQAFGVPTVVNRMSCIYGFYQKGSEEQAWAAHFLKSIAEGKQINIFGDGKQVRDMLFGADCARLYLDEIEHIEKVKGQVFNIGGGVDNTMSLLEAISYIEELTGKNANLAFHEPRFADQKIWISDITKIKNNLGWEPMVSPREGIKRMWETKL